MNAGRSTATKRWGVLRLEALARDGGLCVRCRAEGRTVLAESSTTEEPIRDGGDPWSLENCESVCRACHTAGSARDRAHPRSKWAGRT